MDRSLMVYSVDVNLLRRACGSGDAQVYKRIWAQQYAEISQANRVLGYATRPGQASLFEAIKQLIMGANLTFPGELYAYGFEFIVRHLGQILNNVIFHPTRLDYLLDDINPTLLAAGVSVDLQHLLSGRLPVQLPAVTEFPKYGYWTPEAVVESVQPLYSYPHRSAHLDTILQWLMIASSQNQGLVGYYY